MKNYEIESCNNLLNFLNDGIVLTNDDINIAVDICTYFRKMINDMHNGIIKNNFEIKTFYKFFEGYEDLVYDLENKLNELIYQRLLNVLYFYLLGIMSV